MQAEFLNDELCKRLVLSHNPTVLNTCRSHLLRKSTCEIREIIPMARRDLLSCLRWHRKPESFEQRKNNQRALAAVRVARRTYREAVAHAGELTLEVSERSMENITDVEFSITTEIWAEESVYLPARYPGSRTLNVNTLVEYPISADDYRSYYVEVEPTLDGNYPSILRKMRKQMQKAEKANPNPRHFYLCYGEFVEEGGSIETVRTIFAEADIRIVRLKDIRPKPALALVAGGDE